MKILIIDNGTSFLKELCSLLKNHKITIISLDEASSKKAKEFDLAILSGGHKYSLKHHANKYSKELNILKHIHIPVLGICLGFEIIAFLFGAKLARLHKKEKGIVEVSLSKDIITAGLKTIKVYESHRWVIKNPGRNLVSIGTSRDGVEIIKHKSKSIYGFQFHPEITRPSADGKKIFLKVISVINKSKKHSL